ncbi:hypothetical protein [Streptomyces subrutilus]|uniref:hypothetical protein n=1 Tax=Streptomyces subrutilus TaxID=36818 RepID=UPI0033CFFC6B
MTESEKTTNSRSTSGGSSNGTKPRSQAATAARDGAKAASTGARDGAKAASTGARDGAKAAADATSGAGRALAALPAPLAEKTVAAAQAVRGTVGRAGWIWTAVRARKAIAAGAATAGAVVVTTAYSAGRRAGLRQRGPLSRLTGGRI